MLGKQAALVYTMVIAAEADHDLADAEAALVGDIAGRLPLFNGVPRHEVARLAVACSELVAERGRAAVLAWVREALPRRMRKAAYALACTVVAADRRLNRQEFTVLEQIRDALEIDPALAALIERSAEEHLHAA